MKGHTRVPGAGWFRRLQLEIHDDRLLAIPHDDGFARLIWIGINLLVRHIRRNMAHHFPCFSSGLNPNW